MASPTKTRHLHPLTTHWQNRSLSSISAISDAATFHSANAHPSNMEMHSISYPSAHSSAQPISTVKLLSSPKLEAIKMDRQDSGYSDTLNSPTTSSRRTSTSSMRRSSPSKSKRRATASSATPSTRPSTKRASRSSPSATVQTRTSLSGRRPSLNARHTSPYSQNTTQPYQFFQFPVLSDPQPEPDTIAAPVPPPPATVQYWTSDSTRRLEYAAIDAASRGVRGFFIKMVPDCMLPASSRRPRFHCDDEDSDAGSVRRYRLVLPEEKDGDSVTEGRCEAERQRVSALKRWGIFGRSSVGRA